MIAHQVAGKATRDALFLSQFEVTLLPRVVLGAALLSMLSVVLSARLLAQYGPSKVIPPAFALSAGCFALDWLLYPQWTREIAVLLYLQMAVFGAVLISGFWSVINERFDPYTARPTIARIAAAATLGGVVGGIIAGAVADAVDARAMLIVLAAFHAACFGTVRAIGAVRRPEAVVREANFVSGVRLLASQPYLRWMALLMSLAAVLAALLDYAFKSAAASSAANDAELVAFFGQFYAAIGVATFLLQSLLGPRVLKRFGIGAALVVMPAVTLACGLVGLAVARTWAFTLLRGAQMVAANSLFRSSFELLYTPLPPLTKRPTKAIIDVAADRLGDVLGSGILLVLIALAPVFALSAVVALALLVAALALLAVRRLHGGYIAQLASSLRDGAISLREDEVVDATTRMTLAEVSSASERELLAAKIRVLKQSRAIADSDSFPVATPQATARDARAGKMGGAIADLLSGEKARIRRCLNGDFMDVRLAPFLLPLLADDELAGDVRTELRWLAPQLVGTLADALASPDLPLAARQRIPSIIEVTHSPRAARVLLEGLDDEEFNVRYSCARALVRMHARDPYMALDAERVFVAIERELTVDGATWRTRGLGFELDMPDAMSAAAENGGEPPYSVAHVFTLLGLVLDREAVLLALRAVTSSDRALSGTALEYLENVLPDGVRRGLWPHLGDPGAAPRSYRPSSVLAEDLKRGAVS